MADGSGGSGRRSSGGGPYIGADARIPRRYLCEKVAHMLTYQFGGDFFGELFRNSGVKFVFSRRTGRIREVRASDGELLFSYRPNSGIFKMAPRAALYLTERCDPPRFRVRVRAEAARHASEGRTVFTKHVLEMDPELRVGSEAVVTDPDWKPAAVGKVTAPPDDYASGDCGAAVNVKKGLGYADKQ